MHVFILGQVRVVISRQWFNQFWKSFVVLETVIQGLHFLLYNLLDIFAPLPPKEHIWKHIRWLLSDAMNKWTYRRLRVTYSWLIVLSLYTSMHYINARCRNVIAVNLPMRVDARTFSEQVIASIIYDSSCVMSDVAYRTAPPIGGLLAIHCQGNDEVSL